MYSSLFLTVALSYKLNYRISVVGDEFKFTIISVCVDHKRNIEQAVFMATYYRQNTINKYLS